MRKISIFLVLLLTLFAASTALVSCDNGSTNSIQDDNGSTSSIQPSFEGTWRLTEVFQTNPPPGYYYDMTNWKPELWKFSGDKYQVTYDGKLTEEGTFILIRSPAYHRRSSIYWGGIYGI